MIRTRDPRQAPLIDPWGDLGPKRRQLLENSWAGLFRREILSELPVEQLALHFRADFGRPAKELHTVLGVLVLQQMHDLTDLETVNQLAFNQQWHYALDIPSESDAAKYMCPKTLWTMRKKVTDQELDTVMFQQVAHKLARVFEVDTTKQRLDSVHLKSNMRRLGRLGILTRCINRFLVNLKRQHPELYAGLEPELTARYDTKKALACFSQVKPSASEKTLAAVAQEGFDLLQRFAEQPQISGMLSYRLLHRAVNDHCEVKAAGMDAPAEITVKPPREVSCQSLQNPSDPEAGYSGHKGQGYQAQVMETFCDSEDPRVKARTLNLITHVAVAPASESDSRALLPALTDTQARELGPQRGPGRRPVWQRRQLPKGRGPGGGGGGSPAGVAPGAWPFSDGFSGVARRPGPGLPRGRGAAVLQIPQAPLSHRLFVCAVSRLFPRSPLPGPAGEALPLSALCGEGGACGGAPGLPADLGVSGPLPLAGRHRGRHVRI